ncbi:DNA-binding CsgD family transcriptional regulator [Catenulispora sp. EB89]|uniref:response regulator transcription factor n=1 Tax=Catenulispora sp. EB89 TaxID=3156257 RepID=UPI0035165C22
MITEPVAGPHDPAEREADRSRPGRSEALLVRARRATFATRVRCADDEPRALIALAGELAADGERDAALDLLLAACTRQWMSGNDSGHAFGWRVAAATAVNMTGAAPEDRRARAVAAFADPRTASPNRGWNAELEFSRDPDVFAAAALEALARADVSRAAILLDIAVPEARRAGRIGRLTHLCTLRSRAAIVLGDWHAAAKAAEEACVAAVCSAQPWWLAHATAAAAVAHAATGDAERAWRLAAEAEVRAGSTVRETAQLARAVALSGTGQYAEARHVLVPLLRQIRADAGRWEAAIVEGYLAEAAVYAKGIPAALTEALALAPAQTSAATPNNGDCDGEGTWSVTAPVTANRLYARALLAGDDTAQGAYEHAREAAAGSSPWLAARVDLAHGMWLRRQRRIAEARPILQTAAHMFDSLGAVAWAERARGELRASGSAAQIPESPSLPSSSVPPLLTSREQQIMLLVAEGLTNREIGRRMFLSPRTIGSHLYRIFPKLGITSRAQLAVRAQELLAPEAVGRG